MANTGEEFALEVENKHPERPSRNWAVTLARYLASRLLLRTSSVA